MQHNMNMSEYSDHREVITPDLMDLEIATREPVVQRVLDQIATLNEMIMHDRDGMTEEDIVAFVVELDRQWLPMLDEEMAISGGFRIRKAGDVRHGGCVIDYRDPGSEFVDTIASGSTAISKGVVAEIGTDDLYRFKLIAQMKNTYFDSDDGLVERTEIITIDPTYAEVEFDKIVSPERARAWLECYYPDMLAEIDVRIFDHDGGSAESILSLRDIDMSDIGKDDRPDFVAMLIGVYLNSVIEPDRQLPYAFIFDGKAVIDIDTTPNIAKLHAPGQLMVLRSIVVQRFPRDDMPDEWLLCVVGSIHGMSSDNEMEVELTIDGMIDLQSMRDKFYGN